MARKTGLFGMAGLFMAGLLLPVSVAAQQPRAQPSPELPASVLGPQLIVWSQLQQPTPVPQPLPGSNQPAVQVPVRRSGKEPATPQAQTQSSMQTFTGTIVKDGGRYLLKLSDSGTYLLDDQSKAKEFEGKQVKIGGSLDTNGNVVRVLSVESVS
jgi:hypothetical protein